MKEKLLLKIASIFPEFAFKKCSILDVGIKEQYDVFIESKILSDHILRQLLSVEPFNLNIENTKETTKLTFYICE